MRIESRACSIYTGNNLRVVQIFTNSSIRQLAMSTVEDGMTDGVQYFEGVEKLLEIWFTSDDDNNKARDLRKIPRFVFVVSRYERNISAHPVLRVQNVNILHLHRFLPLSRDCDVQSNHCGRSADGITKHSLDLLINSIVSITTAKFDEIQNLLLKNCII